MAVPAVPSLLAMSPAQYAPLLFLSLIGWRMYRRVRSHIGRQRVQPRRMVARAILFGVVAAGMGVAAWWRAQAALAECGLAGGLAAGALLGWVGLRLTRFEVTAEGRFYTPNTLIGVGVAVLLVGRVAYRMFLVSSALEGAEAGSAPAGGLSKTWAQSGLTLFLFGLLAGYYMAYYAGVWWRARGLAEVGPSSSGA